MERDELREALDKDELDYPALAAEAGPESMDELEALVAEDEPRIASKAAYLASLVDADNCHRVVDLAAHSRHDVVRASAAAAIGALPEERATPIARNLLGDADPGIRARAVKSLGDSRGSFRESLRAVAEDDDDPDVRRLAADLVDE
jgi:HEAT repeat protein